MMTKEEVRNTVELAQEYIKRCRKVLANWPVDHEGDPYKYHSGTQDTAALKRQSMELTRALANLRKSAWEKRNG
jgi:alkanesulfonate monooxygenase SsuD/methylene tetrahydromethanopterin reductase-like flavin-dependent oxidoreductase (luciferase family)